MVFMREIISAISVLISVVIVFSGCGRKVSDYSVEEYIQRISEKGFLAKTQCLYYTSGYRPMG